MGIKYVTVTVEDVDTGLKHGASKVQFTTTAARKHSIVCGIGTSEEEIDLQTGVGEQFNGKQPLMMFARNHDDTNYVEIGFATTVYNHRLEPEESSGQKGMPFLIPLNAGLTSVFAKANTAECEVEFEIWFKD